jgi:DNA invertase Pin-like site-specific DNA recombinase
VKPRGGAREGAGRKPIDPEDRLLIGEYCHALQSKIVWTNTIARAETDPRGSQLRELQAQNAAMARGKPPGWWLGEDHRDDVDAELHRLQGTQDAQEQDEPASRLFRYQHRRPMGASDGIVTQAARIFGVSPHTVRKCWTEYRKWKLSQHNNDLD